MTAIWPNTVRVLPQYGYGWSFDGVACEAPVPFDLDVLHALSVGDRLVGVVAADHIMAGFLVLMTPRSADGHAYNLYAFDPSVSPTDCVTPEGFKLARHYGFAALADI